MHEPQPRQYNFEGRLDLVKFVKLVRSKKFQKICKEIGEISRVSREPKKMEAVDKNPVKIKAFNCWRKAGWKSRAGIKEFGWGGLLYRLNPWSSCWEIACALFEFNLHVDYMIDRRRVLHKSKSGLLFLGLQGFVESRTPDSGLGVGIHIVSALSIKPCVFVFLLIKVANSGENCGFQ